MDLTPLYPESVKPAFVTTLRKWYITTYQDQFFVSPPKWFAAYMWMEAVYHLPLSVWVVGALVRGELVTFLAVTVLVGHMSFSLLCVPLFVISEG